MTDQAENEKLTRQFDAERLFGEDVSYLSSTRQIRIKLYCIFISLLNPLSELVSYVSNGCGLQDDASIVDVARVTRTTKDTLTDFLSVTEGYVLLLLLLL
jgi:hypothetical protein